MLTILDKAIALSRDALALAQAESFEPLIELDKMRQALIIQINTSNLSPDDTDVVADKLTLLQQLNEQIQQCCIKQRDYVAHQVTGLNQGNKAMQAYRES